MSTGFCGGFGLDDTSIGKDAFHSRAQAAALGNPGLPFWGLPRCHRGLRNEAKEEIFMKTRFAFGTLAVAVLLGVATAATYTERGESVLGVGGDPMASVRIDSVLVDHDRGETLFPATAVEVTDGKNPGSNACRGEDTPVRTRIQSSSDSVRMAYTQDECVWDCWTAYRRTVSLVKARCETDVRSACGRSAKCSSGTSCTEPYRRERDRRLTQASYTERNCHDNCETYDVDGES